MKTSVFNFSVLVIICGIIFNASAKNLSYKDYPSYKAVFDKFYKEYSDTSYGHFINFAKKPDGWHVLLYKEDDPQAIVKDNLFWSRKDNKFLPLNYPKATKESIEASSRNYFNSFNYSKQPYYGYVGWDMDVINELEKIKDLPDSLLEALARAYSDHANNFLNNYNQDSDPKLRFKLKDGKNSLSNEQMETYRKYQHLSTNCYKKLYERNPKYDTYIGGICGDYSNSYITAYYNLDMYQNESEAKKELVPGLYNPEMISVAENYLSSCAQNAVLFTNADNDTYPLWYVQAQYGFRKDVQVINLMLLNTDRYIDYIKSKSPDIFSLKHEQYKMGTRDYIYMIDDKNLSGTGELKDMLAFVKSDDPSKKYKSQRGDLDYIPTHDFSITINKDLIISNGAVPAENKKSIVDKMEWSMKGYGMTKNKFVVLDIISTNNWKRPVYFAVTCGMDYYMGLEKYFQLEGMAYRLVPVLNNEKVNEEQNNTGSINISILFDNLMKKFSWGKMAEPNTYVNNTIQMMCMTYRNIFARLASELLKEGQQESALKVLDECMKVMPDNNVPYDYFIIPAAELYYKAGVTEKANMILNRLTDIETKYLQTLFSPDKKKTEEIDYERQTALAVMEKIYKVEADYKQDELSKKTKKIFDEYSKKLSK